MSMNVNPTKSVNPTDIKGPKSPGAIDVHEEVGLQPNVRPTKFKTIEQLKELYPEFYNNMLKGFAQEIMRQMEKQTAKTRKNFKQI